MAQHAVMTGGAVSIVFAALGFLVTIVPDLAAPIAIGATTWAFVDFFVLERIARRANAAAALIQEQLDTWLYDLEWDDRIGQRPPSEDVNSWARKLKTHETDWVDWYPNVNGIPDPYAVLLCQRTNLVWDRRLRHRYAAILMIAATAWSFLGVGIGLIVDLSVRQLVLSWFVPSTPALIRALREGRAHGEIASEKERLFEAVRAQLESPAVDEPSEEQLASSRFEARRVQSHLFALRLRTERVPTRLYHRYQTADEQDIVRAVDDLRRRLLGRSTT
jgi:hypothetical protein